MGGTLRVGEGSTGDTVEIAALIDALQQTASAVVEGDPAGVANSLAAEEVMMSFGFMQPGDTTVANIPPNVETIAPEAEGPVRTRYLAVTVHIVSPDFARSLAYGEFAMLTQDDGQTDVLMSGTDIRRKIYRGWRAVHEHGALPINMPSGAEIMKQMP
jgi:hypothetical protein